MVMIPKSIVLKLSLPPSPETTSSNTQTPFSVCVFSDGSNCEWINCRQVLRTELLSLLLLLPLDSLLYKTVATGVCGLWSTKLLLEKSWPGLTDCTQCACSAALGSVCLCASPASPLPVDSCSSTENSTTAELGSWLEHRAQAQSTSALAPTRWLLTDSFHTTHSRAERTSVKGGEASDRLHSTP